MPSKSDTLWETVDHKYDPSHSPQIKEEICFNGEEKSDDDDRYKSDDDEITTEEDPISELPLEVITTIQPYNIPFSQLKNMSNGVLTHRNIFTEQEREILRKIVEKYRSIVDTRRRTRETYLEKQTVWQNIVTEFNGCGNVMVRTEKELKKCWDNMKYRARLAEKEQQKVENDNGLITNCFDIQKSSDSISVGLLDKVSNDGFIEEEGGKQERDDSNGSCNNWKNAEDENDFQESRDEDTSLEDEQPVVKKARQESPKLSSILLGETKKTTYSKNEDSPYILPNYMKVSQPKKKSKKFHPNPISILPKGLNSCVSIMNIPNPNLGQNGMETEGNGSLYSTNYGSFNLGGGITISSKKSTSSSSSYSDCTFSSPKILPKLRKILSTKSNSMREARNDSQSLSPTAPNDQRDCLGMEEKLILQQLEFDLKEHHLKMKVLEKQLSAYTNEAHFWELKLKLLKNGHENFFGKLMNGNM